MDRRPTAVLCPTTPTAGPSGRSSPRTRSGRRPRIVGEPACAVWETWTLPSSVPSSGSSWAEAPLSPAVEPLVVLASSEGDGLGVVPPLVVPPLSPPLLVGQVSEGTQANLTW
ncbi:hypothetical protein ACRAWF_31000 [Streptomyces sp. L7]